MKALFIEYAYPALVTFSMFLIYLAGSLSISNKKGKRIKKAKRKEVFEPIHGDVPEQVDEKEILKMGIDSIRARFVFIQKLWPILLLALWVIILSVPYLSALPAIYISLIVGIASVVAGIALKPFLENIIAGIIVSFFQPFRVGDTVRIEGQYGVIERIDLTQCVLRVWDWKRFVIPNSKMLTKEIQNLTMHDSLLWAHVSFYVEPDCDLEEVEEIARSVARKSVFSMDTEEPVFWVTSMEKDAVECWVAAWVDNPSAAWELRCEIRKELHKELRAKNISFQKARINIENLETKALRNDSDLQKA